jgi:hypothetical protein
MIALAVLAVIIILGIAWSACVLAGEADDRADRED